MANPIDVVVAKTKGMVKGMEARREGLIGVFETLAKEHGEAAALMDRVNADAGKRASLWPKIKTALVSHERGELAAVYPVLNHHAALKPFVAQHAKEAAELDRMIERLEGMSIESDDWASLFTTLASTVVGHATEEENEIFPVAMNAIGVDEAKRLDAAFKDAKARVVASIQAKH